MQVVVTFRNIEASDAIRDHAVARLRRIRKFMRRPIEAHLVLEVVKHRHTADVSVTADRSTVNATEETDSLYSAIDAAMNKVERQLKKRMEKRQSRKHETVEVGAATRPRRPTVRTERVLVRMMSVREAVSELDSGEEDFLVFQNSVDDALNIAYRRKNGTVRIMEPEVPEA